MNFVMLKAVDIRKEVNTIRPMAYRSRRRRVIIQIAYNDGIIRGQNNPTGRKVASNTPPLHLWL